MLLLLILTAPVRAGDPLDDAAAALSELAARAARDHKLPSLRFALFDDRRAVESKELGTANKQENDLFRVGSISKLFTSLTVMKLVEAGKLDLDAPVTKYLPDFKPEDPFNGPPITLRMLISHRSGLVREPPVGNYFDASSPSLSATVASLNRTRLVHRPGAMTKYSNAAIAVVGRIVEVAGSRDFGRTVNEDVLAPLGMTESWFGDPRPDRILAASTMWTLHGREFKSPAFGLGMAPAGNLYSRPGELAAFGRAVLNGGGGIVKPETIAAMWKPQFVAPGVVAGFGLGFDVGLFDNRRKVGHSGAIYGFATELMLLPDDKVGIVVIAGRDCANAVTEQLAERGLKMLLAAKAGKPLPTFESPTPVDPEVAKKWAGRYAAEGEPTATFELSARSPAFRLWPLLGDPPIDLKATPTGFVGDGGLDCGTVLTIEKNALRLGAKLYRKLPPHAIPLDPPTAWANLVGEYGWDHNTLYVHEREGKLYALIEWFFLYPLTQESEHVFAFPESGLYAHEKLVFIRDRNGRATQVAAGGVSFPRRLIPGEGAPSYRIRPERPVDELLKEAASATPPAAKGEFNAPDLIDLAKLDPTLKFDIRYATANNFLGVPVYPVARALLQRPAAEALARVQKSLAPEKLGLLIHDAYRPWAITKVFWEATPTAQRIFVADPSVGSRHNRGCAVDLTLYDTRTNAAVTTTGGYDEFSDRSYPDYPGGTSRQRWCRERLRAAMEAEGFAVFEAEWWHFDYREWRKYPVQNAALERAGR